MRVLIDSMIVLLLLGILAAVVLYHRRASTELQDQRFVVQSLTRLHEQAVYRGALASEASESPRQRFLRIVRPEWFPGERPANALVGSDHPWIDVAPVGDVSEHPPDPVCDSPAQAGIWYNPTLGIFRARVPRQVSERQTLDLYNQLNGTALASLARDDDPARTPIALTPADLTTAHASPNHGSVDVVHDTPPQRPPQGQTPRADESGIIELSLDEPAQSVPEEVEQPAQQPVPQAPARPTLRSR